MRCHGLGLMKPAPADTAGVSQHLAKLRMARLVQTRRQGTQLYHRLANDHVRQLMIDAMHHSEHAGPGMSIGILTEDTSASTVMDMRIGIDTQRV
jgi:hypothetical protein